MKQYSLSTRLGNQRNAKSSCHGSAQFETTYGIVLKTVRAIVRSSRYVIHNLFQLAVSYQISYTLTWPTHSAFLRNIRKNYACTKELTLLYHYMGPHHVKYPINYIQSLMMSLLHMIASVNSYRNII